MAENNNLAVLKLERPYYEQEELNEELKYSKPKSKTKFPNPCHTSIKKWLLGIFPIVGWLSKYNIKRDLLGGDLMSGCTVGVLQIPQGMGYAILANVPAITGIYTAFFPSFIYLIFGTSRHNSMGTFAVVSIMIGKTVNKYAHVGGGPLNATVEADQMYSTSMMAPVTPVEVASSLCFLVGLIQLVMYTFRLGIVTSILSETLVSGFTTGAAIHVLTSQVKDLFGIAIPRSSVYFEVIFTYVEILKALLNLHVNWTAIIISAISITVLVLNNDYLKPYLAKKCFFPVPIELIAIVGGTLASKIFDLNPVYNIKVIGDIPTGFPAFGCPRFELLPHLIVDAVIITIVSYTVTASMALIFATRSNYEVDLNQELLALGNANVFGSFFSCLPIAASLSRSSIQYGMGGKTQIASFISCSILLVVLLWVGPFFEPLPRCVLASTIVVSLKGMLKQVTQFRDFWRLSRLDAIVWMAAFVTVVVVAIDIGLLVGVILSLACIFIRGMKPYTCLLGNVPRTDFYLDVKRYKSAEEIPFVKIFHYCGSVNFASRNIFKSELCRLLQLNLAQEIRHLDKTINNPNHKKYEPLHIKCVIIDFIALSYIDPSGCTSLKQLFLEFNKIGIIIYIAGASCPTYELMRKCNLKETENGSLKFFPTVHDAVHQAIEATAPISVISEMPK